MGDRGYAFVQVKPEINRNRKDHTIDVTFKVEEGPRVYVERIDIVGNVRTLDKVIRREMQLVEGDAFNATRMQRSQQRIKNLGFFKKVEVTNAPGSAPDKTVVTVEVEEQSTGELSLGFGLSTSEGPLADIDIHERNFLGRGQDLRVNTIVSLRSQQIDLSFTEPYFLDRNIAAGFDLFEIKTSPTVNFFTGVVPPYQQFSYGGALRAGYQITDNLRQTLKYTARSDDITDIQSDASLFIALQAGQHVTSEIGQVLLYDRRDDRLDPTAGYYTSLGTDFAGVGFGVDYVRAKANFGYYYSIAPEWVLSLTAEAGDIQGWGGQDVLLQDRFFVGGDNLRGFQSAGIGPRDSVTDDALGGQKYYVGSLTLGVPLGLPRELGLSGRVFTDFGSLWELAPTTLVLTPAQLATTGGITPTVEQSSLVRVSAGVGVSWKSPLGPIRLDLAVPDQAGVLRSNAIFPRQFRHEVLMLKPRARWTALALPLLYGLGGIGSAAAQQPPTPPPLTAPPKAAPAPPTLRHRCRAGAAAGRAEPDRDGGRRPGALAGFQGRQDGARPDRAETLRVRQRNLAAGGGAAQRTRFVAAAAGLDVAGGLEQKRP